MTTHNQQASRHAHDGHAPATLDGSIGSEVDVTTDAAADEAGVSRRTILRIGAAGTAALGLTAGRLLVAPSLSQRGLLSPDGVFGAASIAWADALYQEAFPTSALILSPFSDALPIPKALAPVPQSVYSSWANPPGPGNGQQNSLGNERHQIWPSTIGSPDPIVYKIDVLVRTHTFTTSKVLPINAFGQPTASFDAAGATYPAGTQRTLPLSTIYGFNGTFPGPRINAEYGKPVLVRFENHLDENPLGLDRQDFGSPDWSFLTHLHNGHTAPESDGNPHYSMRYGPKHHGYSAQDVGRQPVPELAGRWRRPGEAELLLVPRPPDGPHGLERLQGHGRPLPHLRPEERSGHGRRAPGATGCPASAPTTPTGPSTSTTTSRWPSTTAGSTTASRSTRTSTTGRASSRPPRTRPHTRSGGARRSTSTSRTTASSATSSRSTARPTRRWR